jgi:hypothetical protein
VILEMDVTECGVSRAVLYRLRWNLGPLVDLIVQRELPLFALHVWSG